jgi:hypothetical protein
VLVLEPERIHLTNGQSWIDRRRQMDNMMERLVAQGLRPRFPVRRRLSVVTLWF